MNTWIALILRTGEAKRSFLEHLTELIATENDLSKAKDLESLHFQRGLVEGLKRIRFLITSPPNK
jgi:hypothetical protein